MLRIWTTSSGGSFSDRVVNPARSEKKMVTSFFSPPRFRPRGILHDLGQQRIGQVVLEGVLDEFLFAAHALVAVIGIVAAAGDQADEQGDEIEIDAQAEQEQVPGQGQQDDSQRQPAAASGWP